MKGKKVIHKKFPEIGIGTITKAHSKTIYVMFKSGAVMRCNKSDLIIQKEDDKDKESV